MYFVYAVYNEKHNKIYVGQTKNLDQRIRLHNDKSFKQSYTARFDGSWELVYKEEAANRTEALRREKELKSHQGRDFVRSLINNVPR
jgi:putative endonuclease